MWWWFLRNILPGPLVRLAFGPHVEGLGNVPRTGPVILAGNHLSIVDPVFVQLAVPRQLIFAANMRYVTRRRGLRWFLLRRLMLACRVIAVGPGGPEMVSAATEVLLSGKAFCVFPEGVLSPDGTIHRGRTGVARVALATGAPIVPVAMLDTDRVWRAGRKLPSLHRVHLRFGGPMRVAAGADARAVTDAVMLELARLTNREHSRAAGSPTPRRPCDPDQQ